MDKKGNVEFTLYSVLMIDELSQEYSSGTNPEFTQAVDILMNSKATEEEKNRAIGNIADEAGRKEHTIDSKLGLVDDNEK